MFHKEQNILKNGNAAKIPEELVQSIRHIWHEDTNGGITKPWKTRFFPTHLHRKRFCFEFGKWDRGLLAHLRKAITGIELFPVSADTFEYWEAIMEYLIVANRSVFPIFDICQFSYRSKGVKLQNPTVYTFEGTKHPPSSLQCPPRHTLRVAGLPPGTTAPDLANLFVDGIDFYIPFTWRSPKHMVLSLPFQTLQPLRSTAKLQTRSSCSPRSLVSSIATRT